MCKLFWVVFSQKFAPAIGENIPRFVTSSAHFDSQLDCFAAPHKKIDMVFALPNAYVVTCLRLELGSIIISALIEDWLTDIVVNVIAYLARNSHEEGIFIRFKEDMRSKAA